MACRSIQRTYASYIIYRRCYRIPCGIQLYQNNAYKPGLMGYTKVKEAYLTYIVCDMPLYCPITTGIVKVCIRPELLTMLPLVLTMRSASSITSGGTPSTTMRGVF